MQNQFLFPAFFSLQNKTCLIVGFGRVGMRKLHGLLSANPYSVLVLDLKPLSSLSKRQIDLLADRRVRYEVRSCTREDISGCFLVFAATNNKEENARIAKLCANDGVLCNSASCPQDGSFIIPANITKNNVCLAISTGGASPALAKKWLEEQKLWLDNKASFALFMGKLRCIILTTEKNSDLNANFFRKIVNSSFEEWFISRNTDKCAAWLQQELSSDLYNKVKEILYDLT